MVISIQVNSGRMVVGWGIGMGREELRLWEGGRKLVMYGVCVAVMK